MNLFNYDTNLLLVEGKEEQHIIPYLLDRHIHWGDIEEAYPANVIDCGGVSKLLKPQTISTHLKTSGLKSIGIIVDADGNCKSRFDQVSNQIVTRFHDFPTTLNADGLIWKAPTGLKIGVWVMPDNLTSGMMETFLSYLLDDSLRELWDTTQEYVDKAKSIGGTYKINHRDKASIYAFLSVQDEPGNSLGTSAMKGIFDKRPETANKFVEWFISLFEVEHLKR